MIFSMFHCSHSLSNRNAKCHVKKSARRFFWRGFGSGETETDEFGVKELPERKENSPQDSSASNSPGNQELDQSCMFHLASGIDVNDLDNVDFVPSTSNLLVKKLFRVYFEDNKVQNGNQRTKSDIETCFQNPQSCSSLVMRSN